MTIEDVTLMYRLETSHDYQCSVFLFLFLKMPLTPDNLNLHVTELGGIIQAHSQQ